MRSALKMTLVAASLAAAFTASAQPGSANRPAASAPAAQSINSPTPARNARRAMRHQPLTPEQRQARFDSTTAQQAQILKITAAQRPQWDAYVQAKKSMFDSMGSHRDTMRRQYVDHRPPTNVLNCTPSTWKQQLGICARLPTGPRLCATSSLPSNARSLTKCARKARVLVAHTA